MALQLKHILACVGMGRLEMDGDALVDDAAIGLLERQIGGMARTQHRLAKQGRDQGRQRLAGSAHHADAAASGRGGNGGDGGRIKFHACDCSGIAMPTVHRPVDDACARHKKSP